MPNAPPPTYVLQRTFGDVDDLAAEARQWDLDFRQLDRGKFHGEVLQFAASGVHISDACFSRSLNQKGSPPEGMRTVAVPARRDLRLNWRGKVVDGQSLMLFPLGSELSSVSEPGFHIYTCSFPAELLSVIEEDLEVGSIEDLADGVDAIRVDARTMDLLRSCLFQVCQIIRKDPGALHDAATVRLVTQELPSRLITAIATKKERCPAAVRPKRQTALARAEAYIELNASCVIGVGDICQAAGVSERTLQYAFLQKFGIGPKEFLNIFRLVEVRRQLRVASLGITKVTDIANNWGFWHMGQFAADYRQRFDELPSETLQRSASS